MAEDAAEHLQDKAEAQQRSGADFVSRLADTMRQAGHAFDHEVPFAARGINSAADYVEDAAEKIRSGTFRDLVAGASDFAKRQPAAFLGLSVLAGFAAVRFFKASGNSQHILGTGGCGMSTQSDLGTISTLLGDALSQSAKLVQNEVDLAKAELGEKLQQIGWAIGFFAAAAVLVIPALVMALFALAAALMEAGWSQPSSYLVSAVVAAAVAGVLFAVGLNRLDARNLAPRETMSSAGERQGHREGNGAMSNFLDNLKEAVRENPLSAALIGGGALWLLIGKERLKNAASSVTAATAPSRRYWCKSAVERAQIHKQSADRSGN